VFDKVGNLEVIEAAWSTMRRKPAATLHVQCGDMVNAVLQLALERRTFDNCSGVLLAFHGLKESYLRELM
jgi:hypothetical protein